MAGRALQAVHLMGDPTMHHLTRAAFAGAVALIVVSPRGAIAADRPIVSTHDGFVNVVRVENGDVWRVRAFPSGNGGNGTIRYQVAQYDSEGNWDGKSWG